jgi:flagellar basal body-associated protein FliL
MNTTKPKTNKSTAELIEIKLPAEKIVSKKVSKKSSTAKASQETEPKEVVENINSEEKISPKKSKAFKTKVIRDSFSFPEQDYIKISELKKSCLTNGIHVKKSEILRAGLLLLSQLNFSELKLAVEKIEKVQTGRPNSAKNQ